MSLAEQLLDAQVAWAIQQLTGDTLADHAERAVDDVLAATDGIRLDELVDRERVKRVARRLISEVPATEAAAHVVRRSAEVIHDGPAEPVTPGAVLDRDHVEALVGEILGATHLAERTLDEIVEGPLAAAVASRFVSRVVSDVLATNRAVAEKIPGVGSLIGLGSSAASRGVGAATGRLEGLVGGAAGRSAQYAAKRLSKIVMVTLRDPATRDAVMEVWDLHADRPMPSPSEVASLDDVLRFIDVLHTLLTGAAASAPIGDLVERLVDGFFSVYGEHPPATLLADLGITRDELVADARAFATSAVDRVHAAGELEPLVRSRLAPFWESTAVRDLLP